MLGALLAVPYFLPLTQFVPRIEREAAARLGMPVRIGALHMSFLPTPRLGMTAEVPPLRARPGDIPALARYFADRFSAANGLPRRALTPAAEALLLQHPWPGNVRELENAMHRAVLLAEGAQIGPEAIELSVPPREVVMAEIPAGASATPPPSALVSGLVGRRVEEVERDLILETLTHCLGNRTRAAEILGISIRTLRNKLHEYRAQGVAVAVQPGFLLPGGR